MQLKIKVMIYKLPEDRNHLTPDMQAKVSALRNEKSIMISMGRTIPNREEEWNLKFEECRNNKIILDGLLAQVKSRPASSTDFADIASEIRMLTDLINRQEDELLRMLSEPVDSSATDGVIKTFTLLSRQGTVNIRPPKGVYTKPKGRK
jgi:hypothetical protein